MRLGFKMPNKVINKSRHLWVNCSMTKPQFQLGGGWQTVIGLLHDQAIIWVWGSGGEGQTVIQPKSTASWIQGTIDIQNYETVFVSHNLVMLCFPLLRFEWHLENRSWGTHNKLAETFLNERSVCADFLSLIHVSLVNRLGEWTVTVNGKKHRQWKKGLSRVKFVWEEDNVFCELN